MRFHSHPLPSIFERVGWNPPTSMRADRKRCDKHHRNILPPQRVVECFCCLCTVAFVGAPSTRGATARKDQEARRGTPEDAWLPLQVRDGGSKEGAENRIPSQALQQQQAPPPQLELFVAPHVITRRHAIISQSHRRRKRKRWWKQQQGRRFRIRIRIRFVVVVAAEPKSAEWPPAEERTQCRLWA